MNRGTWTLLSAGIGAAAMYYFDPARGRHRRALVRDRVVHVRHKAQHELGVVGRDLRNRAIGTTASLRSLLHAQPVDDHVLADRVRAAIGREVSHPASIEVHAHDGIVTLSGPILADEVPRLLECVRDVRGVRDVEDRLEVHTEPGHVPGLQGEPRYRPGRRSAFMQTNWSPTARAAATLAGAAAMLWGLGRRHPGGALASGAGLVLLGRALTNIELARMLGLGDQSLAVNVQKTIRIHAPVETVYRTWCDFERFPTFMKHVVRVRRVPDRGEHERWRWTVRAALGLELTFDAMLTEREENRRLAWHTVDGALIRHAGQVQFRDNADGSTTIDVKLVYDPIAGAFGHAIARLVGADPKHQLDDDLLRMKTYLETGKPPHDAAVRTAEHHAERRYSGNGSAGPDEMRPSA
ncbi:MAG: SRPBCC family protein [Gammaproteobacteria bacterium]